MLITPYLNLWSSLLEDIKRQPNPNVKATSYLKLYFVKLSIAPGSKLLTENCILFTDRIVLIPYMLADVVHRHSSKMVPRLNPA